MLVWVSLEIVVIKDKEELGLLLQRVRVLAKASAKGIDCGTWEINLEIEGNAFSDQLRKKWEKSFCLSGVKRN